MLQTLAPKAYCLTPTIMRAKKTLGQNFLHSKSALNAIVTAGDLHSADVVLEVGPGKGVLTHELLLVAKKVIAVEKDHRLLPLLKERFAQEIISEKLILIEDDILNFLPIHYKLKAKSYKIIANIPYYITGIFLRKFLESSCQPQSMVVLLQKEVAKRIVARDKKESILSLSVKAYGQPQFLHIVKRTAFRPAPNVDSAILRIDTISKNFFSHFSEKNFFMLVKEGFKSKRKKLLGNLKSFFSLDDFKKLGISPNARAEDLALSDWGNLAELYAHTKKKFQ